MGAPTSPNRLPFLIDFCSSCEVQPTSSVLLIVCGPLGCGYHASVEIGTDARQKCRSKQSQKRGEARQKCRSIRGQKRNEAGNAARKARPLDVFREIHKTGTYSGRGNGFHHSRGPEEDRPTVDISLAWTSIFRNLLFRALTPAVHIFLSFTLS